MPNGILDSERIELYIHKVTYTSGLVQFRAVRTVPAHLQKLAKKAMFQANADTLPKARLNLKRINQQLDDLEARYRGLDAKKRDKDRWVKGEPIDQWRAFLGMRL